MASTAATPANQPAATPTNSTPSKEAAAPQPQKFSVESWKKRLEEIKVSQPDMNKIVMDFLLVEGFKEVAEVFEKESATKLDLSGPEEAKSLETRTGIRNAVQSGQIEEAVKKLKDIDPKILEDQSLDFRLKQQHLIELIRKGLIDEALEFARKEITPLGETNSKLLEELEKTIALLAFENAGSSPLAPLLDPSQRQRTANKINSTLLSREQPSRGTESHLMYLLNLLKTKQSELEKQKTKFPKMDLQTTKLQDA